MTNQEPTKRTASQRLDDMERATMSLYQTVDAIARDVLTLKEAVKLLGNKMDSIVKATQRGEELNDEVLSKIMIENNVEELKQKVTNLVTQGVLKSEEIVSDNSFVVGRELDDSGIVVNPRMQFVVSSLQQEQVRTKFKDAKVGQLLNLEEGKWKFEIMESYSIVEPTLPTAEPVAEEAKSPETAPTGA